MITYYNGDILKSGADYICHQVNCKGIMGAGLALQIREAYPQLYDEYKNLCNIMGANLLGQVNVYVTNNLKSDNHINTVIVNMYAQEDYGRNKVQTDYEAFESCVRQIINLSKINDVYVSGKPVIAFPYKIGCGLAGGDWNIVEDIIKRNDKD